MDALEFRQDIIDKYTPELIELITKEMKEGVEVKDRRHRFKHYAVCFVGKDMVQWLISNFYASTVDEAIEIGNYFIENNVFHHVMRDHWLKNKYLFYRFEDDEKDRGHSTESKSWHDVLKEHNGRVILPEEFEKLLGELTDWHAKSPGEHQIHEMLLDPYNCDTLDNCRPMKWSDPTITTKYDMIAIGAGAGGLVTAIGTAISGGKAAIIERNMMGGDCLNTGCVPSKAFIKCAKVAHTCRTSDQYGIMNGEMKVDFGKVMEKVRAVRAKVSNADSVYKMVKKYGIDVYLGHAEFTSPTEITVNGGPLTFSKACVATGGKAFIPPIEGLKDFPYFASENVFNITEQPKSMIVIGCGPIGCELGQAFARLGTKVMMVSRDAHFLPREDPDAASYLHQQMLDDGVQIYLRSKIIKLEALNVVKTPGKTWAPGCEVNIEIDQDGISVVLSGDSILIATGRTPNVHGVGLEEAGIEFEDRAGIKINDNLRTTNKNVYAVGDVCSKYQFTHNSDVMARQVIRNALFFGKEKYSSIDMAWATYTDPEIAHVGKYGHELDAEGVKYDTYTAKFDHNDRAICDGVDGLVKIHTKKGADTILGCTIVGGPAGDMICNVSSAMHNKVGLSTFGTSVHPYPTYAEVFRALSGQINIKKLSSGTKTILRTILDVKR